MPKHSQNSHRSHSNPNRHQQNGNRGNRPHDTESCPDHISKDDMQAISAPYNFVPLADWVHIPSWWEQVSHDHPFKDGLCGEIHYALTATSPLLVGGTHIKPEPTGNNEWSIGEVHPFQLPDGRYAIPGSGLKGMLRSVIEIAGFGRMRLVDEVRPGLRDISKADSVYALRVKGKIKPGFLEQLADGSHRIIPCEMRRLDHRKLAKWLGVSEMKRDHRNNGEVPAPIFSSSRHSEVSKKYAHWSTLCKKHGFSDPYQIPVNINDSEVTGLNGTTDVFPVLTGQVSDMRANRRINNGKEIKGKYKDFVFFNPDEKRAIAVSNDVWRDFLDVHGNDENERSPMSWPGFWRRHYNQGTQVPVFYLEDKGHLRIGLAFMPKLAGDYSTLDLIENADSAHRQTPGKEFGHDLADLLFGSVNAKQQSDALRGRVSFETAVATSTPTVTQQPSTILNTPKASYFPNYLTQQSDPAKGILNSKHYATYIDGGGKPPTVRGFKRYPARPQDRTKVQKLTREQSDPKHNKVNIRLHTLDDAIFSGRIIFHNLKPAELGALLWALTWDGNHQLRHGLGMGKSFGFGQVRIDIDPSSQCIPNDPTQDPNTLTAENTKELINAFKEEMEQAADAQGGWDTSPQISNLLAMADPSGAQDWCQEGRELRHMHLIMDCKQENGRKGVNEFLWAKQHTPELVLADYASATGRLTEPGTGGHPWLQETIPALMKAHNESKAEQIWGGKPLADEWASIDDPETKQAVLAEIKKYWKSQQWNWDNPPKGAKRKARTIYAV